MMQQMFLGYGGGGAGASGGNIDGAEPGNGYKYHVFTSSGALTVASAINVELLLVAGGVEVQDLDLLVVVVLEVFVISQEFL